MENKSSINSYVGRGNTQVEAAQNLCNKVKIFV